VFDFGEVSDIGKGAAAYALAEDSEDAFEGPKPHVSGKDSDLSGAAL
jgi:hypothetical protein